MPAERRKEQAMRKSILAAAGALALSTAALPPTAFAQMADGQVTKIDVSAGKITLKHGPLKKLDMDEPMTMVFRVQDPAMLKQVKVGDKVKFEADRVNGQITVTKIEKSK
jgi:Cu(I)/Ag(I) efflux system periplasmic protein CusF